MNDILKTVTIEQFKEYFFRDFSFLNYYDDIKKYKKGVLVYDEDSDTFYRSLKNNNNDDLNNTDSWEVVEDEDKYNYVTNEDVQKALTQAIVNGKEFGDDCNEIKNIFLHLVAYYLVVDLKNASQGVNSSFAGVIQSKHVGDVSESYAIPTWLQNSPMYSMYGSNGYGLKYLSLIAPFLACTLLFSRGGSTCG